MKHIHVMKRGSNKKRNKPVNPSINPFKEEQVYTMDEMEGMLTMKEQLLVKCYVMHWNKARAAREAGYSAKSARGQARDSLRKPHVARYLAMIKADIERAVGFSKTSIIAEHYKLGTASLRHIHTGWVTRAEYDQIDPDIIDAIKTIDTKTTRRVVEDEEGTPQIILTDYFKLEMHAKNPHLVEIAKLMGYYEPEKVEQVIKTQDLRGLSTDELQARAKALETISQARK